MSEVQQLMEQITLSYEAAQRALTSPSIMAKHAFIQKRMEEIEIARDRLTTVLGDELRATEVVVKTLAPLETSLPGRSAAVRGEGQR